MRLAAATGNHLIELNILNDRKKRMIVGFIITLISPAVILCAEELRSTFNADKPILPSSQSILYAADASIVIPLLDTVEEGKWDCNYYFLNYNSDFTDAEKCKWFSLDENESDWISGYGPFSNDSNMFLVTEWPSQVRPILVRRHFNITKDVLSRLDEAEVSLYCSYDEDPKAYLNGNLIWSATGWNDNDYASFTLTSEMKSLLREGDNVLAVSLKQGAGGGHIDYGLYMELADDSDEDGPGGGPDGVESILTVGDETIRIYNLQGQYLGNDPNKLSEGIFIINNKKVLIIK